MENRVYFSIIVPVYKVEKYLSQCVTSVCDQTFKDFELILVDDGSPDSCPAICDSFAEQDERIIVIHKDNGGLSSARNVGMKCATGKYIIFLDSDDYWNSPKLLEHIYEISRHKETDIIVLKHLYFYDDTNTFKDISNSFKNSNFHDNIYENRLNQLVSEQLYDTCAWNKCFARALILKFNLNFKDGVIAEDIDWAARLMLVAQSIDILPDSVYVYRKGREGAITSSLKLKNIIDTKESILRCLNYSAIAKRNEVFKNAYYSYLAYRYVIWLAENEVVKSDSKKAMLKEMKQYKWLLKYDANKKVRLANIVASLFGIGITAKMLGFYLKKQGGK